MAQQAHSQHVQAQQDHQRRVHAHAHAQAQVQAQAGIGYNYSMPGAQHYAVGHNMSTGQPQYSETMQGGGGFGPQATYNIQGHMASGNVMSGWQPGMVDQGPMPGMQSTGTMQQMPVTNDYEYWQVCPRPSLVSPLPLCVRSKCCVSELYCRQ